jgi:hypothetical protein
MDDDTADEVEAARAPLVSLLGKSEKALPKLAPGTWQRTRLEADVRALRIALALLGGGDGGAVEPAREALDEAVRALESMIERVAGTKTTFAPGTSQRSLQRNRLRALRAARAAVLARVGGG